MPNVPATDGFVGLSPDGAGKAVDTSIVTTSQGAVHRERDNIADGVDADQIANVRSREVSANDTGVAVREIHGPDFMDLQKQILMELRSIRMILQVLASEDGLNKVDDFDPQNFTDDSGIDLTQ